MPGSWNQRLSGSHERPARRRAAVIDALDACGVRYTIGGSLASSFSGEPRASLDVDIVVDLADDRVDALLAALGDDFYADADALRRAVRHRANVNLIHHGSGVKIDLFIAGSPLEMKQLERRRRAHVGGAPDQFVYMHSPEDILLQKLDWFRRGGETSDRQWRDVLSILIVQRGRLDGAYLLTMAAECGLSDPARSCAARRGSARTSLAPKRHTI